MFHKLIGSTGNDRFAVTSNAKGAVAIAINASISYCKAPTIALFTGTGYVKSQCVLL